MSDPGRGKGAIAFRRGITPPPRRAWGALGWGVLFFAGVQLAMAAVLERWRPDLRDPEYGAKLALLRSLRAEHADRPLVVTLGSSRVDMGIRPDVLPASQSDRDPAPLVVNFGMTASGPVRQLLCLRRLLAEGIRPAGALVECWAPFLTEGKSAAADASIEPSRLSWHDLSLIRRYCPQPRQLFREWCQARVVSCFSSRFVVLSRLTPVWLPLASRKDYLWTGMDRWGWLPSPDPAQADEYRRLRDEACNTYRPILRQFRPVAAEDRALRELLSLCRREGIAVALVSLPEGKAIRDLYAPGVRAAVNDYLDRLSREYRVPLIDAHTWGVDADFLDAVHLLPRGAGAFTQRLAGEVLPLLLHSKPIAPG